MDTKREIKGAREMSSFDNSMEQIPGEDWEKFMSYMRGDHDRNGANMDAPTPNLPYRLAREMQEFIVKQAETSDYVLGRAERYDLAHEYALHLIDQNAVEPSSIAFDGLIIWNKIFGGGNG